MNAHPDEGKIVGRIQENFDELLVLLHTLQECLQAPPVAHFVFRRLLRLDVLNGSFQTLKVGQLEVLLLTLLEVVALEALERFSER